MHLRDLLLSSKGKKREGEEKGGGMQGRKGKGQGAPFNFLPQGAADQT